MTDEILATDQFGLREITYPVAFFCSRGAAEGVIRAMDRDGWFPILHNGAIAAYQDKHPVVPFLNGVDGRRHVVLFPMGKKTVAVTAHVDKDLSTAHAMDKRATAKFVREFTKRYKPGSREPNPGPARPAKILVDMHSYPPDTTSAYGPYDMCLLRVPGATEERFIGTFARSLKSRGYKVGIIDMPAKRADLIADIKRSSPRTQVALLEVNERFQNGLGAVAEDVAAVIHELTYEGNPPRSRLAAKVDAFNRFLKRRYGRGRAMNPSNGGKVAVFTMGLPGSGKTTVSRQMYGSRNFAVVDPDEEAQRLPGYDPKRPWEVIIPAQKLAEATFQEAIQDRSQNILIDTTGTSIERLIRRMQEAKNASYSVKLLYVVVPLEVAIQRNRERERTVDDRYIYKKAELLQTAFDKASRWADSVQVVDNYPAITIPQANPGPVLLTVMPAVIAGGVAGTIGTVVAHYLETNPSGAADTEAAMYETFHAFAPSGKEIRGTIPDPKPPVEVLGRLTHVVYWCSKWNRENVRYIHHWKKAYLDVGEDENGTLWLNGKASVKDVGITDYGSRIDWRGKSKWTINPPKRVVYLGVCEEIAVDMKPIKLKRTALVTDKKGERLYLVKLPKGVRPSHPAQYRG